MDYLFHLQYLAGCEDMKMYLISDNMDTRIGLRLVGIDGIVVHTSKELKEQISYVTSNKDIGIVLIVENLARKFPDMIMEIKMQKKLPLVVEIPDRQGTARNPNFISSYIKEATGIKM